MVIGNQSETPIIVSKNGHQTKGAPNTAVVKIRGHSELAEQYIIPGETFRSALARTSIKEGDESFLTSVTLYHDQMLMFNWGHKFDNRIETLTDLLNGRPALGGINRSLSAMVGTGIYYPAGAGIKESKKDKNARKEAEEQKKQNREEEG